MAPPLKTELHDRIRAVYRQGVGVTDLAKRFGVARDTVRRIIEDGGDRTRGGLPLSESLREHVLAQYYAGVPVQQIADTHSITKKSVEGIVRRAGAPPRPRGNQPKREAVQVPAWVPASLVATYIRTAALDGEEDAASLCRALKRSVAA